MVVLFTTPVFAAKLYLKDGGVIQAKRVWRADGKVYVLATRHTMTSFQPSEVNMKRTFARHHRVKKNVAAVRPQAQAPASVPNGAAVSQKAADEKEGKLIRSLPKMKAKSPESLVPSSGAGGSIKQHKKEMAEKLGDQ